MANKWLYNKYIYLFFDFIFHLIIIKRINFYLYLLIFSVNKGFYMQKSREKFVDLAEKRVTKALKAVQLIGNLSNSKVYGYTPEDISEIFKALNGAVQDAKSRFSEGKAGSGTFKLVSKK